MNVTEELKALILSRYNSIREFTIAIDIPYSTFDSMLRREIQNANINNVIKVCNALHISADALAEGKIKSTLKPLDVTIVTDTSDSMSRVDLNSIRIPELSFTIPVYYPKIIGSSDSRSIDYSPDIDPNHIPVDLSKAIKTFEEKLRNCEILLDGKCMDPLDIQFLEESINRTIEYIRRRR